MTLSSSAVGDTLWIKPGDIRFKIGPSPGLVGILGGDWDIERRHLFEETAKYRSIVQRFVDGLSWLETDLFTDVYQRRMLRDGQISGHRNLPSLAGSYERRIDRLVDAMRLDGFRTADANGKPHPLPILLIGREGDVFIGNQGNHRLAIAQMLGLNEFAGRISCKHPELSS